MKLRALGKQGEFCNDASVPIITGKEKVIGFRQLQYTIYKKRLMKKEVFPETTGWVYLTDRKILMLNEGWIDREGTPHKEYEEVPFEETVDVRYKIADTVWVDLKTADGEFTIGYRPYGAASRLFDWLKKQKDMRVQFAEGTLESPYAKDKWYRHPPK